MTDFITDCLNDSATIDDIDDYIDRWHNSDTNMDLSQYLGLGGEEYAAWVINPATLREILRRKKIKIAQGLTN